MLIVCPNINSFLNTRWLRKGSNNLARFPKAERHNMGRDFLGFYLIFLLFWPSSTTSSRVVLWNYKLSFKNTAYNTEVFGPCWGSTVIPCHDKKENKKKTTGRHIQSSFACSFGIQIWYFYCPIGSILSVWLICRKVVFRFLRGRNSARKTRRDVVPSVFGQPLQSSLRKLLRCRY